MSYTPVTWVNAPATTTPLGQANLNHLETGVKDAHYPPVVTALPGSPLDGQIVWFSPASFQSGTPFHPAILARYRATTFDTYHWECAGGMIDGTQGNSSPSSVSSVTYVAPTGAGGPTNLIVPAVGEYDVEIGINLTGAASGTAQTLFVGYDRGATPAVDADSLVVPIVSTTGQGSFFRRYRTTFTVAGVTLVPKVRTSSVANTPSFAFWAMRIIPLFIN